LLDWNWDFDNPNDTEDNWEAGNESNIELDHGDYDRETPYECPTEWSRIDSANMEVKVT